MHSADRPRAGELSASPFTGMSSTEEVSAREVRVGDTVLNFNGWWRVVARAEGDGYVELSLGKPSRPYLQRMRPDELVMRMRRAPVTD